MLPYLLKSFFSFSSRSLFNAQFLAKIDTFAQYTLAKFLAKLLMIALCQAALYLSRPPWAMQKNRISSACVALPKNAKASTVLSTGP